MGQVWYLIVSIPDLCTLLTYICQFLMILFRPNFNDKRYDFDSEIFYFPFLGGDVPSSSSYGVYISQLIRFARASSHFADFNIRN